MEGYYDPHPTHHLERPLVLVGFVNHLTRSVASTLASMTGLPLGLLDELVEHQLGGSAHHVIEARGLEAWRRSETQELAKAVRARPAGVIALGEGVLADPDNLNLVLEESDLVYLSLPEPEACLWASQQSANHGASLWAEVQAIGGPHQQSLQGLFEARRFNYELAHLTIDVSRQSVLQIANRLKERLTPAA